MKKISKLKAEFFMHCEKGESSIQQSIDSTGSELDSES